MATLYRYAGKPQWYARFHDADGKRVSRATGTTKKREAREIAADLESKERDKRKKKDHLPSAYAAILDTATREAVAGELTLARSEDLIRRLHQLANPSFRVVSLKDHLAAWVEAQRPHVTEKTSRSYGDMARRMVAAVGPKTAAEPVGDLTREQIEKALVKITKTPIRATQRPRKTPLKKKEREAKKSPPRHVSATTANMDLGALRRALRAAVEEGLAKANAAEAVRPLPTHDSTERAPFTAEEVRQMLNHADTPDEWKGAILIAAHTGLRMGDVIRLMIRPEKTKRARKTLSVPLTPPCLRWIGERQGDFFPTLKGQKPGTLSTRFVRIMERVGVPREITEAGDVAKRRSFHSLRHSFASWLAEADVHADVRQKLTGHQSAGVHARYTHHDEALDRAVKSLPNF
jgi:integrase